jgi:2-oxoisovalerate dehydrogenase E1 component
LDEPILPGSQLTRRHAVRLYEAALQSRLQDLESRRLKDKGESFYTIGSSGHEANVVFGDLLRTNDPALLHYRSGAFMAARAANGQGETNLFDSMLAFVASAEDPISGGRHKVFGSRSLWVPPQTSTIASQVPKAVGMAFALARMQRLGIPCELPEDSIVYCSFGDASVNHASAQSGFTAAAAAHLHRQPCPLLMVCEDNGLGISVHTPDDYIEAAFRERGGLKYFTADGRDLHETFTQAKRAVDACRKHRHPVFFHLRCMRLMGHAGSDMEISYLSEEVLEQREAQDPLLAYTELLLRRGALSKEQAWQMYRDLEGRIARAGEEASRRPKLSTAEQVMAPLILPAAEDLPVQAASTERRREIFGGKLPEEDERPRHMAYRISQGLRDLMATYENMFVFGEDVARKGGVYHVTDGLHKTYGTGRVFNTILDETTILGLAQGMAQLGCLPFPEIQYLAYLHNAIDQIRGEASTLRFFSQEQFANPMVVRIAGYAYQKGFGGHFHNDNSIGAILEIPGLILASPSRADEAVGMLRTCAAAAQESGRVCVFLEPIALYMTKDLHAKGDGLWQFGYPAPGESVPLGEPRMYGESEDDQLCIVSWANGLHMSLQAQKQLAEQGLRSRVMDLRWLAPLPMAAIKEQARACGRVLVVDECRETGAGPSSMILAELARDPELRGVHLDRLAGKDSFVPLGAAANLVLVQVQDILSAAMNLCERGEG